MTFILGINSILSLRSLAEKTQLIYEHPYTVSNRVHKINTNILALHIAMKNLIAAKTPLKVRQLQTQINAYEHTILKDFDMIYQKFLGDKTKITKIRNTFMQWRSIRDKEIALKKEGRIAEAHAIANERASNYINNLLLSMQEFSDFADNKANKFLHDAQEDAVTKSYHILGTLFIIILIGLYLATLTTKNINKLISRIQQHATELTNKKREVENLVNSITDWLWAVDTDARYTYVSEQVTKQLGYTPDELIGKTPFDFMPDVEAKRVRKLFEKHLAKQEPFVQLTNVNQHKDGSLVTIESSGNPVFDAKGVFQGYQGSDRDVTVASTLQKNIKDQEQMLVAQSRLAQMGELVSMIAHQWRQPLTTIGAISTEVEVMMTLSDGNLMDTTQQEACFNFIKEKHANIQEQIQHLSQTINDFRDFYKPDQKPQVETINIAIMKALNILEPLIKARSINLQTTLDATEPHSFFTIRVVQTLVNIIKNAIDAFDEVLQEQPFIHISSFETTKETVVTILDNAGGISPELLEKIFDPYFSTKGEKNGTGLGLYMSKIIIEKHHKGSISVSSSNNETCFTLTFPHIL